MARISHYATAGTLEAANKFKAAGLTAAGQDYYDSEHHYKVRAGTRLFFIENCGLVHCHHRRERQLSDGCVPTARARR